MEIVSLRDRCSLSGCSKRFSERAIGGGVPFACAETKVVGRIVSQAKKLRNFRMDDCEQKEEHKEKRRFLHLRCRFFIIMVGKPSRVSLRVR
jgi:hypothetical protein